MSDVINSANENIDPSPGGYMAPTGVSVSGNMAEAASHANTNDPSGSFLWFYEKVRNNKDGRPDSWDYKQGHPEFEPFGNFNYGATGAAMGIPDWLLLTAAGFASVKAGPSRILIWGVPFFSSSNGDDPDDQQAIRDGIDFARNNGYPDPLPLLRGIEGDPFTGMPWPGSDSAISPILGTTPDPLVKTIKYVPYVDPLILDLDGDGLEITPLAKGILFDTNADGIKTGTARAGADDALLVRDLNGNGQIDSGAELFGDETILANGQKAAHGFAALSALDSNADGKFDAADTQYASLRLWRDLNQDGISQTGELKTLLESNVASIKLTSTASSTQFTDAMLVQNSSFTRTVGGTGQAGSFILAQNNFFRSFTPIAVSDVAWVCDSNRQRQCTKLTGRQMSVEFGGFQL